MQQKDQKTRVLFPIGAKLVVIISILLLVSLGAVIFLVLILSTQDVQRTAEDNNFSVNYRAGFQAESSFKSILSASLLYLEMAERVSAEQERDTEIERFFFDHNRSMAAIALDSVFLNSQDSTESQSFLIPNEQFLLSNNIGIDNIENYFNSDLAASGDRMQFYNASPFFQLSLITAVFIRQGPDKTDTVKVLFTPDELSESFGTGTNTSYIISGSGDILLHPDNDLVLGGANFSSLPIVAAIQQEGDKNRRQISFSDAAGIKYFGAYYRLAGMDAAVITTIPHDIVFEAVQGITRQNLYLTAGVL
ncbi:MAG: hypothetical protein LBH07_08445, partial [Treponema sp.]|nr:hypothetical protein [Treponema sp.]